MMARRYAVYFAPPVATPLGQVGSWWLGRNAETNECITPPGVAGLAPERLAALTEAPRRYGFHATLKPPMRLRDGCTYEDFEAPAHAWASRSRCSNDSLSKTAELESDWTYRGNGACSTPNGTISRLPGQLRRAWPRESMGTALTTPSM